MLTGRSWWASLGSPRCVAAPMVAQSELAFRLLARRYGAELCYTPMLLAKLYAAVPEYRADHFSTCAADRPLVAQLAGHDPDTMVRAALLLQPHVDAIDINLGCPQGIARKGKYGAYLLPDVERVCQIVRALCAAIDLPITCKVRAGARARAPVHAQAARGRRARASGIARAWPPAEAAAVPPFSIGVRRCGCSHRLVRRLTRAVGLRMRAYLRSLCTGARASRTSSLWAARTGRRSRRSRVRLPCR